MICPFCAADNDKVIDSRSTESGHVIRRRRECLACERRFTTYERIEQQSKLMVVKRDGAREAFDRDKVARGVMAACGKRPVPADAKRRIVDEVEEELHAEFEREVPTGVIGERVMARLRSLDPIAYIRFATEHLAMASVEELLREVEDLRTRPIDLPNQEPLFDRAKSTKPKP